MHIDTLLADARDAAPTTALMFPDHWCQGRTAFGGLTASLLYSAMRSGIDEARVLRSMNTSFVGPLLADRPFYIAVELLREGKSTSQVTARAIQDDKTCVMVQACFGLARPSNIAVDASDRHGLAAPGSGRQIPVIAGVTPQFLRHIQLSITEGDQPFSGSERDALAGWMRFSEPPARLTDAHIIALVDAWPPTLLQQYVKPAPASTVSWNLEFIHPHAPLRADAWLGYRAHTRQAGAGYGHTEAAIWNDNGDLIAVSRQTVALFDR